MTKKDFIKLAQALQDSRPVNSLHWGEHGHDFALQSWNNTVEHITETLRLDNPQFNKARFLHACGYTQEMKG